MEMYIIGFLTVCVIALMYQVNSLQNKVLKYQKMVKDLQSDIGEMQNKAMEDLKSGYNNLIRDVKEKWPWN